MRINQSVYQYSDIMRGLDDYALHEGLSDLFVGVSEHV